MDGCYGGGAIVGAVIGTFLATLVVVALGSFVWKRRKAKQNPLRDLVLVESGEVKGGYENIGFTDEPLPLASKTGDAEKSGKPPTAEGKAHETDVREATVGGESHKSPWAHFGFLIGQGRTKGSRHSFDVASPPLDAPQQYSVSLKGHDFTGLGFSVGGGLKEGIFVKEVMQRGPAAESNKIQPGDRIKGLWVSFDEVVLPDAVALLGHASPYVVRLDIQRSPQSDVPGKRETLGSGRGEKVSHPSFKSSSAMDLSQAGKEDPLTRTPKHTAEIQPVDRASPVAVIIPVTVVNETVQMKSPDILDMRPSAVPRSKDKKQRMSEVVELVQAISPVLARSETPKIQCADVPDAVLSHMEDLSSKESPKLPPPTTEGEKTEPVPKKSKFGIHVLPDLHFGRRSSSPASDEKEEKRKTPKVVKGEKTEELKKGDEDSTPAQITAEVIECHEKERPSSADSSSSKKKFHIRLFHKSKQYTLEPESEGNEEHPSDPTKEDPHEFKVRKMEDAEMEAVPVSVVAVTSLPPPAEPQSEPAEKSHDRSFVSKGLQSLREFKDKVTQKLSTHDTSSSEDESSEKKSEKHAKGRKKPKGKKVKGSEEKGKKMTPEGSSEETPQAHSKDPNQINGIEVSPDELNKEETSESEGEGKPSKPKRSTKRKAPVPPTAPAPAHHMTTTLVTTSAEVEIHPTDLSLTSKEFEINGESKRSASYGDLASHSQPPHKINLSDRATSLDLRPSPPQSHITTTAVVNDLSCVSDQLLHLPGHSTETLSSTASSSSETLKELSPTPTLVHQPPPPGDEELTRIPEVGISTSGSTVVPREEVERVARETVQEIFNKVNGMEEPLERRSRSSEKKPSRIPVPASKSNQVSIVQEETKEKKKFLLRDDSKTRLMQTVADANDIKISPVSSRNHEPKTLEISSKELDGVMMSHSEFLAKQAALGGARESPPKDTSFDNWIYVDQKLQASSSDPASSSHEDEDDMNDSRNLSPVTFRSEAQFDTTTGVEVKMGTTPPGKPGTVFFSTTMTLPQKTVTQITIAPEASPKKIQQSIGTIQLPSLEPTGK